MSPSPKPHDVVFFETPEELRDWFDANHDKLDELWVGMYRKASGRKSITWEQVVLEALCVGWIDGVRYRLDESSNAQRITPRRKGSNWSAINVANVERLTAEGRMRPAGLAAFAARSPEKTAVYSYERAAATFGEAELALFQAEWDAWSFFEAQSAAYRRMATFWVMSAKREETRVRRLRRLIEDLAAGRRMGSVA